MKKILKFSFFALAAVLMIGLASCSKDTDPADTDVFLGTYKGNIAYVKGLSESKSNANGSIIVSKVGATYSFVFSDGIPPLTGVKFEQKDDNTYVSVGDGLTGITITASTLNMLVSKDGATWTVSAKR